MVSVGFLFSIIVAVWVFSDARSRGKDNGVAFGWFLGTLFLLMVFLPIWLIVRPKSYPKTLLVEEPARCTH